MTEIKWKLVYSKKNGNKSKSILEGEYRGYKVKMFSGFATYKNRYGGTNIKTWEDYYIVGVSDKYYNTAHALMAAIDDLIKEKEEGTNGK